jgi:hypothetical protein
MLSEADIINMLEFVIDNIFAMFDGRVLQQTVGIHIGTNCPYNYLMKGHHLYSGT